METLGERILSARTKASLTQQQLAVAARTSSGVISELERGVYAGPGVELIGRIAEALDCTIDELAGPHGEAVKRRADLDGPRSNEG